MYQFCVSGAARGVTVEEGQELAKKIGKALAKSGHSLLTGATNGLPNYAALAYKEAGGLMSVGISPASSKVEHVLKYCLPTEYYDTIIYSGLHYVGRDSLLITSSDAVISIGGRIGTLHEFTISMESDTPIGFLHGAGGIGDEVERLISIAKPLRKNAFIAFNDSPDNLIKLLTDHLDKIHSENLGIYKS